jgi:hypothetical protein
MAGHSQFKNIMFRKGAQDKKRSKLFSKLAREITVAAKTGLPDPNMNPKLRAAIAATTGVSAEQVIIGNGSEDLIGAVFRAFDRRALINSLLQGKASLSGNIPPTQAAFGINEKELITFPGYLEDRAKEEAEAKKMWDAGGGPALGEIIVDIPDIWEGLYSGGSALITNQLKKVLGNTFTAKIEPYSTITTKIVKQQYGNGANNIWYGWITDITDPEPTLLNYLSYNSAQPQFQQFGVKIDKVDTLTNQLVTEFDLAKRQDGNKEVNRELLKAYGAGIPYSLIGVTSTLVWNYYKTAEVAPFVTAHLLGTDAYFDQKDATWSGRPA